MSLTAIATTKELDDSIINRMANDLRLATFVGAAMDGDDVSNDPPDYSQHGALTSVEDAMPVTEAIRTLDNLKNRKLTVSSLNSLGAETDVVVDPARLRFSSGFSVSQDGETAVIAPSSGGFTWHPLDTPVVLVSGATNPSRRLSFTHDLGSQYPSAGEVYGVFRVITHVIGGNYIWMDLFLDDERVARTMRYAVHAEDYTSRPVRLTGQVLSGYFDVCYSGAALYTMGPGVPIVSGESNGARYYSTFANVKAISVRLIGFYY